jgi:hypothetical protein
MQMNEQEQAFLTRRARLIRAWPYAGSILLTTVIGFGGFLFWRVPTLANPYAVLSRLETNSIPQSTMMISAVLLPIAFMACVILAASIVLFTFAHLSNEGEFGRAGKTARFSTSALVAIGGTGPERWNTWSHRVLLPGAK